VSRRPHFLAYQREWLADDSRLKICEKSRRIGWTYVQAYEDVRDAAKSKAEGGMDVWFTSADISAAREYIRYCEQWAKLLDVAASDLGEVVIDEDDDIKALVIEFASGFRINALSSNPKGFRSKGGKVVIDEFAFHENADDLWKAASPSITWGFPIRVFSSHNGKGTRFYRMAEEAKQPGSKWSHHKVTLLDAIEDGLVGRILGKPGDRATKEEVASFLQETKEIAGDAETFEQEYMCNPLDGKAAYISFALIYACEHVDVPAPLAVFGGPAGEARVAVVGQGVNDIPIDDYQPELPAELEADNPLYLGVDIGRHRDLTVMTLLEEVGDVLWARLVLELHVVKFRHQYRWLQLLLPLVRRACIDDTGLGAQLAEDAIEDFGAYKVEGVTFSAPLKADLAVTLKRRYEDRGLRTPASEAFRQDIAKVKRTTTSAGNVRFEGERDGDGHADRFWSLALAAHAAGQLVYAPYESTRIGKRI
jgi:phage FluMu gp28-like protein